MRIDKKFIYLFLLNFVIYLYAHYTDYHHLRVSQMLYTACCIFLFTSIFYLFLDLVYFLTKKRLNFLKDVLIIATLFMGLIEIFLGKNFNCSFNYNLFSALLSTNSSEAEQFLSFYLLNVHMIFIVCILLTCIIFYYFLKDFIFNIKKKIIFSIISILLIVFSSLVALDLRVPINYNIRKITDSVSLLKFTREIALAFISNYKYIKEFDNIKNKLNKIDPKDYIINNNSSVENVVIIIGESAQRNFMHLYGYFLENTPEAEKLQKSKNLFVFTDVIAPGYNTTSSLEKVLTFSDYENREIPWYKNLNLLNALDIADYKSMWFSNQDRIGIYGNSVSSMVTLADYSFYTAIAKEYTGIMDEELIGLYKKFNHLLDSQKKLFVFHLAGSHIKYDNKSTPSFKKFSKQDIFGGIEGGRGLISNNRYLYKQNNEYEINESKAQITADYVNSIYYTDFVLKQIYDLFKDKEAIIFYFSDHGQDVYQMGNMAGHIVDSPFTLEIPFMIFVSDKFKQKYKKKVALIESSLNKPFMNDDFLHSLLDILDIKTKDSVETKSIFNKNFDTKRKRMINGLDYDKDLIH